MVAIEIEIEVEGGRADLESTTLKSNYCLIVISPIVMEYLVEKWKIWGDLNDFYQKHS